MTRIIRIDCTVSHSAKKLVLPDLAETLSSEGRRLHHLELDTCDLSIRTDRKSQHEDEARADTQA
jgi:hypothetical protein